MLRPLVLDQPRPAPGRVSMSRIALGYAALVWTALILVVLFADRTAFTYTLALLGFWWLLPTVPLLVVTLLRRRWATVSLLLVPALIALSLSVPHHPRLPGAHADLRVTTWNITHGAPTADVAALVAAQHPDLLLMQEVTPQASAELTHLRSQYPYVSVAPLVGQGPYNSGDASAVFSRFPIVSVRHIGHLPRQARPVDEVTVAVGGRQVSVISVHLASPCVACGQEAVGNPAGDTGNAARVRVAEARRLAAVAGAAFAAGRAVILAGDINSSDLNEPLSVLQRWGLVDAYRQVGWGPGLTRGTWPGISRVDVVLVAGLTPVRADVGNSVNSTHRPLTADLAWG